MMTLTMTPEARQRLDQYLERARFSLRGTSVEADEVERDVRDHIEEALQGRTDPILAPELDEVLGRLGSPDQWVPEDEIPFWRRWLNHFVTGSEDWRLAYICFALTLLGLVTIPFGGFVLFIGAYLLGRAAVSLSSERGDDLGARKWLIYPPLVFISLTIVLALLIGPIPGFAAPYFDSIGDPDGLAAMFGSDSGATAVSVGIALTTAVAGLWWLILSVLATLMIEPLRKVLVPIANGLKKRHLIWLAVTGVILLGIGAGVFFLG